MNLQILTPTPTTDWATFIDFWSSLYFYKLEDKYNSRINKNKFEEEDITEFFVWKNGSVLSTLKGNSLEKNILSNLEHINDCKSRSDYSFIKHIEHFPKVSAVWNIFLLHLIQPKQYPIYDQHIHRAFAFITGKEDYRLINETISNKRKLNFYTNSYLPFIDENLKQFELKKVDEAFFAFGQFLKIKSYATIFDDLSK